MKNLIKLVIFPTIFVFIAILLDMDKESVVVLFVLYASPMVYKDAYGNRNGLAVRCVKDK